MQFQRILIALDNSDHSGAAARAGFRLASRLNAEVALVSVIDTAVNLAAPDGTIMPVDMLVAQRQEAEQTISDAIKLYSEDKPVTRYFPEGSPKDDILAVADEWSADLIVTGTHGRTGISHLLMGSTAEYIVRHSKIPVLVVPLEKNGG